MKDEENREIISLLKSIDNRLRDIKYDLADIKREMPKVPYYGDLLQDIAKSVDSLKLR